VNLIITPKWEKEDLKYSEYCQKYIIPKLAEYEDFMEENEFESLEEVKELNDRWKKYCWSMKQDYVEEIKQLKKQLAEKEEFVKNSKNSICTCKFCADYIIVDRNNMENIYAKNNIGAELYGTHCPHCGGIIVKDSHQK
jgi:intergrase/recombinase